MTPYIDVPTLGSFASKRGMGGHNSHLRLVHESHSESGSFWRHEPLILDEGGMMS
jgi:hypothetical protein